MTDQLVDIRIVLSTVEDWARRGLLKQGISAGEIEDYLDEGIPDTLSADDRYKVEVLHHIQDMRERLAEGYEQTPAEWALDGFFLALFQVKGGFAERETRFISKIQTEHARKTRNRQNLHKRAIKYIMSVAEPGPSDIARFRNYVGEGVTLDEIDIEVTLGADDASWMFRDLVSRQRSRSKSGSSFLPETTIRSAISRLKNPNKK